MNHRSRFILLAIIATVVLSAAVITANTIAISAKNGASLKDACYESYEIRPDDTLWKIAGAYAADFGMTTKEYVEVLKDVNHLQGDTIYAGGHLIVLYAAE